MSVYIRYNKWVVDFRPQGRAGKQVRITLPDHVKTKEEALAIEQELKRQAQAKETTFISKNPTFAHILPEVLDYVKVHRAASTYYDYQLVTRRLLPHFGAIRLDDMTLPLINIYKKKRQDEGVCGRTINKELHYFSGCINYAVKQGYCKPPTWKIEQIPYSRPMPKVLTQDEIKRLLKHTDPIYYDMILCLYQTGMRWSEASNLKWENVNLEAGIIQAYGKGWKNAPDTDNAGTS